MSVHQLYATFDLTGLSAKQVLCVALAVQHESHRSSSRAKDERLGEDTRAREDAIAKELFEVSRKLRPLCAQADK